MNDYLRQLGQLEGQLSETVLRLDRAERAQEGYEARLLRFMTLCVAAGGFIGAVAGCASSVLTLILLLPKHGF